MAVSTARGATGRPATAGPLLALLGLLLGPAGARAAPVELSFAFFSSDRTTTYTAAIKPFAEAVNAEAAGSARITVQAGGALGRDPAGQLDLVLNGTADLALVIPGLIPDRFPGLGVIALPGLFADLREATLVFNQMMAERAFKTDDDLLIVAAYATEPESIHLRSAAGSLDDMKGRRLRVDNPLQGRVLERLGLVPVPIAINAAASALGAREIDGALASPTPLFEFGIARVATTHYMLGVGSVPLLVVMKRSRFDALPAPAREAIRAFGGAWTAERFIEAQEREKAAAMATLKADARRSVVVPSAADQARAEAAFRAVAEEWAAALPRQAELLDRVRRETARLRAGAAAGR